jgi:bacterioferritin (cytochrome b1)
MNAVKPLLENTLRGIVGSPALNARFANTLSLLEYIGTRKILKSQNAETITAEMLSHIAEEVRHAQVLKKIALRLSGGALATYGDAELLCGPAAREYFKRVDLGAEETGSDRFRNYLLTTLLIEERANSVYPIYEKLLREETPDGRVSASQIAGILRDEQGHLEDVWAHLGAEPATLAVMRDIEARAFSELHAALAAAVFSEDESVGFVERSQAAGDPVREERDALHGVE